MIRSLLRQWHDLRAHELDGPPLDFHAPLPLQSLEAAELCALLEARLGTRPPLSLVMSGATPEELIERLAESPTGAAEPSVAQLVPDADQRHAPFELTDIQLAYLVGRDDALELGGVATHYYQEFDVEDVDLPRLQTALRRIIDRHDMLRAVIADGRQRVLERVPAYEIAVTDLRGCDAIDARRELERTRRAMSHQTLPVDSWPLFEVRAHRLDEHITRISLSIDLLIADARSIHLLLRDWASFYARPEEARAPLEATFRDYLAAERRSAKSPANDEGRQYWQQRLSALPPAPELPYARPLGEITPRTTRCEAVLDGPVWRQLLDRARAARVTPSVLLCTAYAQTLALWSARPCFTLNLTLGDRMPLHPQVDDIVGDFTSALLLEVDCSAGADFDCSARAVQEQLLCDLDHRSFGGVAVQRELARIRGRAAALMPVVFTSLLELGVGAPDDPAVALFGRRGAGITQTPQVCLDHQVYPQQDGVRVVWDYVGDAFAPGTPEAMFRAYLRLLDGLAHGWSEPSVPDMLGGDHLAARDEANATRTDIPEGLLHAGIAAIAARRPDAAAVIAGEDTMTYGELDALANRIARLVRGSGVRPGQLVGVVMEKGWQQVAAVLGILRSGAAYLPIDAALPQRRVWELLEQGEAAMLLTQAAVHARLELPVDVARLVVDDHATWDGVPDTPLDEVVTPDDLAYVIFTSGSTGVPKGVMIEHRAAANTIVDCLRRFGLHEDDRVLGLSSLSFDLSVFDVFATLRAGATLVLPEPAATRDPARWAQLVRTHGVTLWNSVPALLDMLVEYAAGRPGAVGSSLRLAMLSGDWIPVDLPDRLRRLVPGCRVVGMGGATEASIWSVLYEIDDVDRGWVSIPYGRAMANQRLYVLDDRLRPRPNWVAGEIHIAGDGLARGYWRDGGRTAERFVTKECTGERLYRTGDLGRYLPDGNIEFLGREDHQVKIRGYRVELGEIEAALDEHPAVRTAIVAALGDRHGPKRLVAYVVGEKDEPPACELRRFLGQRVPEYMVPQTFIPIDELPLTANGKVDRQALPAPARNAADACAAPAAAAPTAADEEDRSQVEEVLRSIWQDVLAVASIGREQDFFDLGGDSLLAMRVIARAGAAGWRILPSDFFDRPTIAALAVAATPDEFGGGAEQGPVTGPAPLTPSQAWFFDHDFEEPNHWNGFWPLLLVERPLDPVLIGAALHRVLVHHDALRSRFSGAEREAVIEGPPSASPVPFAVVDLSALEEPQLTDCLEAECAQSQASLDLMNGPVLRLTYFDLGPDQPGRLHLAAHWAVLDYYSSRVLFEDLWSAYGALEAGNTPQLPAKSASIVEYTTALQTMARSPEVRNELELWTADERHAASELPVDHCTGPNDQASTAQLLVLLDSDDTTRIVRGIPTTHRCSPADAVVVAVVQAVTSWTGRSSLVVELEAHGRSDLPPGVDVARTVGRCSSFAPLLLTEPGTTDPGETLQSIVEQIRRYPRHGLGHGLLAYLGEPEVRRALDAMPPPPINVNYWGRTNEYLSQAIMPFDESPGPLQAAVGGRPRIFDVFGLMIGDQLGLVWSYSRNLHLESTVCALAEDMAGRLLAMAGGDGEVVAVPLEKSVLHAQVTV